MSEIILGLCAGVMGFLWRLECYNTRILAAKLKAAERVQEEATQQAVDTRQWIAERNAAIKYKEANRN